MRYNILNLFVLMLFVGCGGETAQIEEDLVENSTSKIIENSTNEEASTVGLKKVDKDKFFYVVSKTTYNADENVTSTYSYENYHLSKLKISSTMGTSDTKTYRYFEDSKIIKTYDSNAVVTVVAVFKKLKNPSKRYDYDNRLSLGEKINYMVLPYDSLNVLDKAHISKLIYPNTTGNIYMYDTKDNLLSISNGYFDDNDSGVFSQIEDDENTSFLLTDALKFVPEQKSDYHYDDVDRLQSVTFKGTSEFKVDISVSFYDSGLLRDMNTSTGSSFHYNKYGLLMKKVKTKNGIKRILNYVYSEDFKTVSVKDASGKLVTIYKFEESK